jgi:hypothetical protein
VTDIGGGDDGDDDVLGATLGVSLFMRFGDGEALGLLASDLRFFGLLQLPALALIYMSLGGPN